MNGFFGGLITGLIIAILLGLGGTAPIPTLTAAVVVFGLVWLVAALVNRAIADRRRPRPRFRLLTPETVPFTVINATVMSWCRIEVTNDGAQGTVGVRLVAVRPPMQVNGLGHYLRAMSRPTTEDGNVKLRAGEHQKFDLFWMGKVPGKTNNVPKLRRYGNVTLPGPRRLFTYGVCLKDGGQDLEPVAPTGAWFEFDVAVMGGPQPVNATYEVRISPNGGVLIRQLR